MPFYHDFSGAQGQSSCTMLSNKAEQGLAGTIKQHLSTLVSQGHMLQNKVCCTWIQTSWRDNGCQQYPLAQQTNLHV